MSEVLLILGGTKEAAALAKKLVAEKPNARIISSLAGRTKEPTPVAGEVRIGGFGGAGGLANFIQENHVTKLIDATHPFAQNISANARKAALKTSVTFEQIERAPWQKKQGDNWIEVGSLQEAKQAIPDNARVLLALGSQHIALFKDNADVHFLIRMVDQPASELPFTYYTLELGKPGDVTHETALLEKHGITHIVCRNSGGKGAYAKIEAARTLKLPVILVQQASLD